MVSSGASNTETTPVVDSDPKTIQVWAAAPESEEVGRDLAISSEEIEEIEATASNPETLSPKVETSESEAASQLKKEGGNVVVEGEPASSFRSDVSLAGKA